MLRFVLVAGAVAVFACGCGQNERIAPVSGVVTLNGKPAADIEVTFQPLARDGTNSPGPAAFGVTGPDGRYTAKILGEETRGATVGKNQVRFSAHVNPKDFSEDGTRKTKPTVTIPGRYWVESKIELDVPPQGTSSADFQLTSP